MLRIRTELTELRTTLRKEAAALRKLQAFAAAVHTVSLVLTAITLALLLSKTMLFGTPL